MFFKKTIRKYITVRWLDFGSLVLCFMVIPAWIFIFISYRLNRITIASSPAFIEGTIIQTLGLCGFLYYGTDLNFFNRHITNIYKNLVKEIDQKIIDALILLKKVKSEIRSMITNSNKYDEYSKEVILDKTNLIISNCVTKLHKAEKLRDDARKIPHNQVKDRLLEIHNFLIEHVSKGIDEILMIHEQIRHLESEPNLSKAQLFELEKRLELEIRLSEHYAGNVIKDVYNKVDSVSKEE